MIPVYLITGFLGAGKTTFLKNFASLFSGERLALIVNEFGRSGVDGALLSKLGAAMKEVNAGSIFCACRFPEFEKAVAGCIAEGAEVMLIECSGLSDPADPAAVLPNTEPFTSLLFMGSICLADAARVHKVLKTSRVAQKQAAFSDVILLNKIDQADEETIARAEELLKTYNPSAPVILTSYGKIPPEWAETMKNPNRLPSPSEVHTMDLTLKRSSVQLASPAPQALLLDFLLFLSPSVHRVKGFVRTENGLFLADCVLDDVRLLPCANTDMDGPQELTVLSSGLPFQTLLKEAQERFPGLIRQIVGG